MKVLVTQSLPTLCDPMDYKLARLLCPWNSPGKNTGVGSHSFLQGSNLGLLHFRLILYHLSHQESHIYVYESFFVVHQKQTQHCKSTILQFKKEFKKKKKEHGGQAAIILFETSYPIRKKVPLVSMGNRHLALTLEDIVRNQHFTETEDFRCSRKMSLLSTFNFILKPQTHLLHFLSN